MMHATIVVGGNSTPTELLLPRVISNDITLGDVIEKVCDVFTIDDARELFQQASYVNASDGISLFLVRCQRITYESQNALLKLLEEPPRDTNFLFVTPHDASLLTTLLSRVEVLSVDALENNTFDLEGFIKMSKAKRIEHISNLLEDIQQCREFLSSCSSYISREFVKNHNLSTWKAAGRAVETAQFYLNNPSASRKQLLENVALVLPKS